MKSIRKLKGFTLIEILLVVGFIALAGVVAYITYPKVQAANRANTEATYTNLISAGVKDLYASSPNFVGLTNTVMLNARKFPDSMINGAVVNNTFGGTVTVAVGTLGGIANNAYTITTDNVPQLECSKLVSGVGNNFSQVTVNATVVKAYGTTVPMDIAAAAAACAAGGNANTLIFASI